MTYLAVQQAASDRWPWVEFRRLARVRRVPNSSSDRTLLSVSAAHGVRARPDDGGRQLPSEATVANYWNVEPADLVFNPMWALEGGVAVSNLPGAVSTAYRVYEFGPRLHPRFAHYFARSGTALDQYKLMVRGVTTFDRSVTREDFEAMPFPVPPLREQRAIADYLDTETGRIDALITKKRRMVDLLRQRQVGSEAEAVLRSGGRATQIPTVPSVPDHWQVLRNKVFMREVNEPSITGGEEMLSVSHLTGVTPRSEKTVYMFEAESTVGYKTVKPGDLVINTMWAWMGAAGVAKVPGIVSPAYGVYRIDPTIMTPDYFDILVRTAAYITEMTRFSRGVTSSRLRLYPEEFLALSSPVPPINEQRQIVARCFAGRERTKKLVDQLEHQVELLSEHRQALIAGAVTGDLKVPGVAA